ncbi:hypothetical protein KXD93_09800 [Mucilaginibacter sp. BJC16-A38]|uniref:hypothetical protein n=1 Tax=Mucilaginibacter phenanthrenivorans TaxID=1234842 RepID=UPI0021576E63|nr:hypothetical protein [Mucilaginibacter phenanthrenivorans]MCR8557936.1 hypothetical protein [Mucilaginibacter phenanthrenivorans]
MKISFPVFIFCSLFISKISLQNNSVIQFDISKNLNARPVTTSTNNKLTTWTKGIDGGGSGDGYLTLSAALFNGDKDPHALPDNPTFPANGHHPAIKLHYSNTDSLDKQTCNISGAGSVEFAVPKSKYKTIYLALTSSEGPSNLTINLTYSDGAASQAFVLPDYYADIKSDDPNLCYLSHDLAKWGNKNNMTEKDHHNIDLLKIKVDPKRVLKSIGIAKSKPGYLVFWGATGEKAI